MAKSKLNTFKKLLLGSLAFVGVLAILAGIYLFYVITNVDYKYTGEELFQEVNAYRVSIGAPALELDPLLCDNLVERYWSIREPGNAHKGFEEWMTSEGINQNPKYALIGEIYVNGISTPSNAINFWLGSPGHKSTLEMKEMIYGCAYANDGTGVVIMASQGTN